MHPLVVKWNPKKFRGARRARIITNPQRKQGHAPLLALRTGGAAVW